MLKTRLKVFICCLLSGSFFLLRCFTIHVARRCLWMIKILFTFTHKQAQLGEHGMKNTHSTDRAQFLEHGYLREDARSSEDCWRLQNLWTSFKCFHIFHIAFVQVQPFFHDTRSWNFLCLNFKSIFYQFLWGFLLAAPKLISQIFLFRSMNQTVSCNFLRIDFKHVKMN